MCTNIYIYIYVYIYIYIYVYIHIHIHIHIYLMYIHICVLYHVCRFSFYLSLSLSISISLCLSLSIFLSPSLPPSLPSCLAPSANMHRWMRLHALYIVDVCPRAIVQLNPRRWGEQRCGVCDCVQGSARQVSRYRRCCAQLPGFSFIAVLPSLSPLNCQYAEPTSAHPHL